ncbi:hypothetical protein RhiirA4_458036 [Rhizophagus irregularis]|uniref:Uncharacterized protein n=1 Tax=Rhizophagus irregularis TaxID=588596 RepID=A0A2I1GBG7_9GLOM|nr:hypothetical protein RhiirA4_458036 [Rhizophagus irregularis]
MTELENRVRKLEVDTRITQVKERKSRDVGYVEKITVKRCYKYKTAKQDFALPKNMKILIHEVELISQFLGMQALKKITTGSEVLNSEIIKENIKKYGGFFGKIIRVNKIKYILIYFNNENDIMMKGMNDDIGSGLQLKSQDELIRKNGDFRIIKTQPNNKVSEKSVDEQYYDTRENLTDPLTNDQNKKTCRANSRSREDSDSEIDGFFIQILGDSRLLNNAVNEDNERVPYLKQMTEVLDEIELFYLLSNQRRWKSWLSELMCVRSGSCPFWF